MYIKWQCSNFDFNICFVVETNLTYEFGVWYLSIFDILKREMKMDFHNSEGIKIENRDISVIGVHFCLMPKSQLLLIYVLFGELFSNYNGIVM